MPLFLLSACMSSSPRVAHHLDAYRHGPDIARAALAFELTPVPRARMRQLIRGLDAEADEIRRSASGEVSVESLLSALNTGFFSQTGYAANRDSAAPESTSIAIVLTNRHGGCVGLAIVYLALAQRLGLNAHAVATPVHLFVRVKVDGSFHDVELLEGGASLDDDIYRRRYKIDEVSISTRAFMTDLTNDEVIAHLLSNQAVALSKQGKLGEALARYDEALRLHPKLVVAWYNRGIDLMNAARLKEALDSFNRAIKLYPSDAQAHNNRGLTKARLGDKDGARADFERTLQLEPGMREAEENLRQLLTPQCG